MAKHKPLDSQGWENDIRCSFHEDSVFAMAVPSSWHVQDYRMVAMSSHIDLCRHKALQVFVEPVLISLRLYTALGKNHRMVAMSSHIDVCRYKTLQAFV
jgi:hypothetical protein